MKKVWIAAAFAVSASVAVVTAQGTATASGEKDFVQQRLYANLAEIQLAELALRVTTNSSVKVFAQMMALDHTKANQDLQPIAHDFLLIMPTKLDPKHLALVDRLAKLQGAEFEQQYAAAMVESHQEALRVTQSVLDKEEPRSTAVTSGNSRLRNITEYAARTKPTIQRHLEQAQTLQKIAAGN